MQRKSLFNGDNYCLVIGIENRSPVSAQGYKKCFYVVFLSFFLDKTIVQLSTTCMCIPVDNLKSPSL